MLRLTIFHMDDVEKAVAAGMQQHLKAPHLLREYAKTYQEERERLASEKRRLRCKLETQLGPARDRSALGKLSSRVDFDGYRWSEIQGVACPEGAIEAELAAAPVGEKIVGLHPAALREYEEQVRQLQSAFGEGITPDDEEAANKIWNLICRVILYPSDPGTLPSALYYACDTQLDRVLLQLTYRR